MRCDKKLMNFTAKYHPTEKHTQENMRVYLYLHYSLDLDLYNFWFFPLNKTLIKIKQFESIQDFMAAESTTKDPQKRP